MKKVIICFLLSLVPIFLGASMSCAEVASEGSGKYRSGKSGTLEFLKMDEKQAQVNWSEKGAYVVAPENSPLYNASFNAMGTLYVQNGKFTSTGSVVITRPNGDKVFGKITNVKGVLGQGPTQGFVDITGGTGKCKNIDGKIDLVPGPKVVSYPKGTYQKIGTGTVTWKIP